MTGCKSAVLLVKADWAGAGRGMKSDIEVLGHLVAISRGVSEKSPQVPEYEFTAMCVYIDKSLCLVQPAITVGKH